MTPWFEAARAIFDRIEATQSTAIERASQICADAIAADGLGGDVPAIWLVSRLQSDR